MAAGVLSLPTYEIVIPCVVFVVFIVLHASLYRTYQANSFSRDARSFFQRVNEGWVASNYMKEKACNTTRDYLRVSIFLAGNAIILATVLAGFAAQMLSQSSSSAYQRLLIAKIGVTIVVFLAIFYLFFVATRFAVHAHFLMGVENVGVHSMRPSVICAVLNRAHQYFSAGLRMYYACIPLFAWLFSVWALLAVAPLYMYLVKDFERLDFMKTELDQMLLHEDMHEEGLAKDEGAQEGPRRSKKTPPDSRRESRAGNGAGGSSGGHSRARTLESLPSHSLSLETMYEADERHGRYFRKQQQERDGEEEVGGELWSGGSQRWAWSTSTSTDTSDWAADGHLVQVSLDEEDVETHGNEEKSGTSARRQMSL